MLHAEQLPFLISFLFFFSLLKTVSFFLKWRSSMKNFFLSVCELSSAFLKVFQYNIPDVIYYTSEHGFGSGYVSGCFVRMVGFKINLRMNFSCMVIGQRDNTVLYKISIMLTFKSQEKSERLILLGKN